MSIKPKGKETFIVSFIPKTGEKYEREIKLDIQHNPYASLNVLVTGEGYWEEVECIDLPGNREDKICFDDSGVGFPRTISLKLKNNLQDKHWRFAWPIIDNFKFSPTTGHLHANACKTILVTFFPKTKMQIDLDFNISLYNIAFPEGQEPQDWNSEIPDLAMIALVPPFAISGGGGGDTKTAGKKPDPKVAKKPNPKAKGGKSNGELPIPHDLNVGSIEPTHEVVEGSNKALNLKLHALADSSKYECDCNGIHFKKTMMFQTRTHSFTIKNLSTANLPLKWQVIKNDGHPGEHEIYSVDSPSEIQSGFTENIVVKFGPTEVEDCTRFLICNIDYLELGYTNIRIPLTGNVQRPWCHFKLPKSDYISKQRRNADLPGPNGYAGPLDPDTNIIEFNSLGVHKQNIKTFVAINATNTTYNFIWEQVLDPPKEWHEDEPDRMLVLSYLSNPFRYNLVYI
jgi:hydrocephalus-inducing protein